jgi:serine/threonine protein kinase
MTSEGKYTDDADGGWTHIDFDELELGDRIGGGGVGIIYNGWIRKTHRPVALKTLFDSRVDEKLKKEYMDELLVMSKLKHVRTYFLSSLQLLRTRNKCKYINMLGKHC